MKRILLGAALAIGSAFSAQAADAGSPFKFLLGAGLTFGGDTLITVPFTDGSTDSIKAGGLVHLYGGGEYRFGDQFAVQATVGYHINDTKAASNGSVRFTRIPVDLLALYSVTEKVRLGGGAQFVSGPELKGSGVASNVSQKYDSTTGVIVEGEYLFTPHTGLKLRYVAEKFKPEGGGAKIDGSHVGLMFSYYF
jgi:opacity protein-like surface antigen